jgi:hypothetical protein
MSDVEDPYFDYAIKNGLECCCGGQMFCNGAPTVSIVNFGAFKRDLGNLSSSCQKIPHVVDITMAKVGWCFVLGNAVEHMNKNVRDIYDRMSQVVQ